MAQIAIPIVIAGALYLMSNDKKEDFTNPLVLEELEKGLVSGEQNNMNLAKLREDLTNGNTNTFYNNIDSTSLNTNNSGVYSQYQDKYLIKNKKPTSTGSNVFQTLAGTEMKYNDIQHNNMQIFYNSKSNGASSQLSFENDIKLDTYSGLGSTTIEKKEVSSFFKPTENSQNVYGNQNQSDFFQSRINESLRHANTKPWAEVKDSAGTLGFNSGIVDRDKWMPKKVDELRTTNNPKSNYNQTYQSPAYQPSAVDRSAEVNKINMVKRKPDTYHMNSLCNSEGFGVASGDVRPMQFSEQMLTDPNREHTSVSYYGAKSAMEGQQYVTGQTNETHRQELPTNSFTNLTGNNIYLTKDNSTSYKAYTNSRDTSVGYFGSIQGTIMQNIVDPLVKGLKHTKKSNFVESGGNGNLVGPVKHMVFNPKNNLATTNREMTGEKIGLNHLNIERQDGTSTGYMTANPYLGHTQRESTNKQPMGIATSILPMGKSYDAEYNQRSFEKPLIGRSTIGNMNLFNGQINANINGREACDTRGTPVFIPNMVPHTGQLGMNTVAPQKYNNINEEYNSPELLKAFKSNPYAQPSFA
jgi:hypothetical protein